MDKKKLIILFVVFMLLFQIRGLAQEVPTNMELLDQIKELRGLVVEQALRIKELENCYGTCEIKIAEHEEKLNNFNNTVERDISGRLRKQLERLEGAGVDGLNIGGGMTFVVQGTPNANAAGSGGTDVSDHATEDSRVDASYSADVEIAKQFGEYGLAFIHLETGSGNALEGDLSVFSNVNRDADDSGSIVSITEAWYEHNIFNEQYLITAGKLDATAYIDTNEYANDETRQFLGHMFRNSDVIDFPDDNNLGMRINIAPEFCSMVELGGIYTMEDNDWDNVFDEPFLGAQLTLKPSECLGYDGEKWGGNYRVYCWYNGASHTMIKDTSCTQRGNIGYGLSCDQKLGEIFGWFGRIGWQDPKVSNMEYGWSTGLQIEGSCWKRSEDILAFGIGQVIPGKEYKGVNSFNKNELHFEAYYSCKLNNNVTISPDVQVIWNPNGGGTVFDNNDNTPVFVLGMRGQIDL